MAESKGERKASAGKPSSRKKIKIINEPEITHVKKVFPNLYQKLLKEIPFERVEYFKRSVARFDLNILEDPLFAIACPTVSECLGTIQQNYSVKVKGIFANLYRGGQDKCPYHKDSYDSDVITISCGGTRDFYTKSDKTSEVTSYTLEDGDVIYFNKEWNEKNKHSIPQRMKIKDQRISLVFFT